MSWGLLLVLLSPLVLQLLYNMPRSRPEALTVLTIVLGLFEASNAMQRACRFAASAHVRTNARQILF